MVQRCVVVIVCALLVLAVAPPVRQAEEAEEAEAVPKVVKSFEQVVEKLLEESDNGNAADQNERDVARAHVQHADGAEAPKLREKPVVQDAQIEELRKKNTFVAAPVEGLLADRDETAPDQRDEQLLSEAYQAYLREVKEVVERHPQVGDLLHNKQTANESLLELAHDLKLQYRSRMEEKERMAIHAQRQAARDHREHELDEDPSLLPDDFDHKLWNRLDISTDDLKKLSEQRADSIGLLDQARREHFIREEMAAELAWRAKLFKVKSSEERLKIIQTREDHRKERIKAPPKILHPGSKAQLLDVWQRHDGMDADNFDPRTFFVLHDSTDDGLWDVKEIEALFLDHAEEIHAALSSDVENVKVLELEEAARMREHLLAEVDQDEDSMISQAEFIDYVHSIKFEQTEEWKPIDLDREFSEEDLKEFVADAEEFPEELDEEMAQLIHDMELEQARADQAAAAAKAKEAVDATVKDAEAAKKRAEDNDIAHALNAAYVAEVKRLHEEPGAEPAEDAEGLQHKDVLEYLKKLAQNIKTLSDVALDEAQQAQSNVETPKAPASEAPVSAAPGHE
eukprot:m.109665 g.109665  ORF g.109665 m.109665 type:complete len:569 (+) comp51777_c0_seq1:72-1778(+)